jgi:hypothetical protein
MGYSGDGKPDLFAPAGTESDEGHPIAANDEHRDSDEVSEGINFPVLGIINKVYYADMSTNHANNQNNVYTSNASTHAMDSAGLLSATEFVTNTKGWRLEADVKVVRGPQGVANSGVIMKNVPLCIGFGGVKNYGFVVPTPTTNVGVPQLTGTEDGDWCLVQYIGGSYSGRVITQTWPNQLNTIDPPIAEEGVFAYARLGGTQFVINKFGDFLLDARDAGEEVTTDSKTGAISNKRAGGKEGTINVFSRNDIILAAGFPRTNESESSLPGGRAVLKASKVLSLRSTLDEVTVNTQAATEDGAAMQVKIQNERGSLRPAARKNDKIKITDGDEGDLFSFVGTLYDLLDTVGSTLENFSGDPGALAAGSLINAFIACHPKPTYQEGKIIEGSKYCQIAGKGTAADIGGDESGIVDSSGEQVPSEELAQLEIAALAETVPKAVASKISPNPLVQAKGAIPGSLQTAAKNMEMSVILAPYAPPVKEAAKILPLVFEMISTGSLGEDTLDGNLPDTATGEDDDGTPYDYSSFKEITGEYSETTGELMTPGLVQQSEYKDLTKKYMDNVAGTGVTNYTQKESDDLWGDPNTTNDNDIPIGPIVATNPATGEYWKVGDDTSTAAGASYIEDVDDEAERFSKRTSAVTGGFSGDWFTDLGILPHNQQTYVELTAASGAAVASLGALAADPSMSAILEAVAPVTDVVGTGPVDEAQTIVDEDLASL